MKDTIYKSTSSVSSFEFNQQVVDVFPDMIERSVPGYPLSLSMISVMANHYVQEGTRVYDLGCALGAASLAIQQGVNDRDYHIIAVDNSKAMIDACRKENKNENIEFLLDDVLDTEICSASFVVMNFTLQFIPLAQRDGLLEKILQGLQPGGALILSEKIMFDDQEENKIMSHLHHSMKSLNGYEQIEILNKRDALENILIPETIDCHKSRLNKAGFSDVFMWLRCFNFASFVAIK